MKGGRTLGNPVDPDYIWKITNNLKKNIRALLDAGKIKDKKEAEKLEFLLRTKRWNPYCFRHSAIRHDSTYLPGYSLNQKVRWVPNSKQPGRYMAMTLSEEVERTILAHDGIIKDDAEPIATHRICPRCEVTNALENKLCQKCGYALTQQVLEELHESENTRFELLQKEMAEQRALIEKLTQEIIQKHIREQPILMTSKLERINSTDQTAFEAVV
jgi:integrase/recombinase XerD